MTSFLDEMFSEEREEILNAARRDIATARQGNALMIDATREDLYTSPEDSMEEIIATLCQGGFQLDPNEVVLMWAVAVYDAAVRT